MLPFGKVMLYWGLVPWAREQSSGPAAVPKPLACSIARKDEPPGFATLTSAGGSPRALHGPSGLEFNSWVVQRTAAMDHARYLRHAVSIGTVCGVRGQRDGDHLQPRVERISGMFPRPACQRISGGWTRDQPHKPMTHHANDDVRHRNGEHGRNAGRVVAPLGKHGHIGGIAERPQ